MTHAHTCAAAGFLAFLISFGSGVALAQDDSASGECSEEYLEERLDEFSEKFSVESSGEFSGECSDEYSGEHGAEFSGECSDEHGADEWSARACLLQPSAGAPEDSTLEKAPPVQIDEPSFVRFREDIRLEAGLSDEEVGRQELPLWRYHQRGGDHARMRKVANLSERLQCREGCMAAVLAFLPRAQEFDVGHRKATTMSIRALQDELRTRRRMKLRRSNAQLIERLKARLQRRLQQWQQAHSTPKRRRRGQTMRRRFGTS
jgi:hypothetical protein